MAQVATISMFKKNIKIYKKVLTFSKNLIIIL